MSDAPYLFPCAICGLYDDPARLETRDGQAVHPACADGPEPQPKDVNYPPVELKPKEEPSDAGGSSDPAADGAEPGSTP